jgi:hypothetical protein
MSTKTIPTDKNGNVYYGPKTAAAAELEVARIVDNESDMPIEVQTSTAQIVASIAANMERAGYTKATSNLRKAYSV